MTRSTAIRARARIGATVAVAALLAGLLIQPAGAAPKKTTLSITKLTAGKTLTVAGKITAGTDGLGNIQVAKDDAGDDFPPALPNGTDFTGAWIQADPVKRIATFSFQLDDPAPGFTIHPGWDILWQFTVGGKDTGQHLQIGWTGGFPVPTVGPYALYCTLSSDGFLCDHELEVTFADGLVTVKAPFNLIGAEPGHVIGTSTAGAGVDTLTSNVGMGGIVFDGSDTLGDSAHASNYSIPGGVQIGIAKAGTKITKVATTVFAKVKGTGFSASLPKPPKGSYVVVAKTCYGLGLCLVTSKTITV